MVKGNSSKKGSTSEHQKVVKIVLLKMTTPHSRVWANNTGMIKTEDRVVRFGLNGSSDVIGVYKGLFLGIEVKTGNATQSKDQKNFEAMITNMGGLYVLCHGNVDQIESIVEQKYQKRKLWPQNIY